MTDTARTIEVMQRLSGLGVRLSVDDFGTGYSSLSYLQQLPVEELKIDKCFVRDMLNDSSAEAIVRSVLDLAGNLELPRGRRGRGGPGHLGAAASPRVPDRSGLLHVAADAARRHRALVRRPPQGVAALQPEPGPHLARLLTDGRRDHRLPSGRGAPGDGHRRREEWRPNLLGRGPHVPHRPARGDRRRCPPGGDPQGLRLHHRSRRRRRDGDVERLDPSLLRLDGRGARRSVRDRCRRATSTSPRQRSRARRRRTVS